MKLDYFKQQINRLAETFGPQHYRRERLDLIWGEVQNLSDSWMNKTVDRFIGEFRQPPLLPEFREAAVFEKQRMYENKKSEHSNEAKAFWNGTYHSDDIKSICDSIKKRAMGEMSDDQYAQFLQTLNSASATRRS